MNLGSLSYRKIDLYKGWQRVLIHMLFWLFVFFFDAIRTSFAIKEINLLFFLYTLRQVLTVILLHYFFVYYAIPQLLLKARWIFFALCILSAYIAMCSGMYYTLYFIKKNNILPEQLVFLANVYLKYDFFTTLIDPVRIYNTMLFHSSLFFTLLIKITKDFFTSSVQKSELEKEKIKLEKENIKLELDFLRSQINPHFFFNTLNNIYSIIIDKDEFAADIILKLSDLMRYSLYESGNDKILLKDELKFICDYIDLEKIRHKEHVKINLHVQGDSNHYEIPPLILITFVENAFKHGVNNTIEPSWVKISINIKNAELTFIAQNSKSPRLRSDNIQGGIGIVNLRRRLDIMYPERYKLMIDNNPLQYMVKLKLQLNDTATYMHDSGRRTTGAEPFGEIYK